MPAKFLVLFIKEKGAPILTPVSAQTKSHTRDTQELAGLIVYPEKVVRWLSCH